MQYKGKHRSTWRCTTKKCKASVHTRAGEPGNVIERDVTHNHEDDVTDVQHSELKELNRISLHETFTLYKDAKTVLRDRNTLYQAIQHSYLPKQSVLKASI